MPDKAALCRHFIHLHDVFKGQADKIQELIDETVDELDAVLVGPYRTDFLDDMKKAQDTDARIAAAKAAAARLQGDMHQLMDDFVAAAKSGLPTDPWPRKAKWLLEHLEALLRALQALRALEADMGIHVTTWCG